MQRRDVAQVDAGDGQGATAVERPEGDRYEVAGRREEDGGVERLGRFVVGAADRRHAERTGGLAPPRAGEHVDGGPLVQGDLGGQMGRCAEAVDAERPPGGNAARRSAETDDAAHSSGAASSVDAFGEGVGELLVHHREVGVAAVVVPSGERRL